MNPTRKEEHKATDVYAPQDTTFVDTINTHIRITYTHLYTMQGSAELISSAVGKAVKNECRRWMTTTTIQAPQLL